MCLKTARMNSLNFNWNLCAQDGGTFLVAIDDAPEHNLSLWDWQKGERGTKITETKVIKAIAICVVAYWRWRMCIICDVAVFVGSGGGCRVPPDGALFVRDVRQGPRLFLVVRERHHVAQNGTAGIAREAQVHHLLGLCRQRRRSHRRLQRLHLHMVQG